MIRERKKINVIFTALPNGEAQKIAKKIPKNIILIDLSADFRLQNPKTYKRIMTKDTTNIALTAFNFIELLFFQSWK